MTIARAVTATLLLLPLLSCEKSSTPTNPPPAGDSGAPPASDSGAVAGDDGAAAGDEGGGEGGGEDTEPGAPGVAWHDKTFQQKKTWMGVEVFPKMKTAFQEHDAAGFKKFTCDTCHGAKGKEKGYKMPSDDILPLAKDDPMKAGMEFDEDVTKFMVDKVVPGMITMLQGETNESFGCLSCHPAE